MLRNENLWFRCSLGVQASGLLRYGLRFAIVLEAGHLTTVLRTLRCVFGALALQACEGHALAVVE